MATRYRIVMETEDASRQVSHIIIESDVSEFDMAEKLKALALEFDSVRSP